ncbi:MAG: DUF948 domain-containing protein [bacterium]
MEMDLALKIFAIAALIAFILLSIFAIVSLIGALKNLREVTQSIEKFAQQLDVSLNRISNDFGEIKVRLSHSLDNFDSASEQITSATKSLQDGTQGVLKTVSSFTGLFDRLYDKIVIPVNEVTLYVSAIGKAVTTFSKFLGKGK